MSQSLAISPAPQLPNLFAPLPPDGGGDGLSTHSDAFTNTLEAAQNSLQTDDGDNSYDGSGLDGPASMGARILGKLGSLSAANDAQMSEIMKPLEHTNAPTLSADGTENDSNVIGAGDPVGQTLSRTSTRGTLKELMNTTLGTAQLTMERMAGITLAGNIATTTNKLISQQ
jgi:hypothetical protein